MKRYDKFINIINNTQTIHIVRSYILVDMTFLGHPTTVKALCGYRNIYISAKSYHEEQKECIRCAKIFNGLYDLAKKKISIHEEKVIMIEEYNLGE